MKLYFSGIAGELELDFLLQAGVDKLLFDPFDLGKMRGKRPDIGEYKIALDSGAYREFKGKQALDIQEYKHLAESFPFEIRVAKDVIGDPGKTFRNWTEHFSPYVSSFIYMPVWEFGAPTEYLQSYLDESWVVGIGGLVPRMREKDEQMLKELKSLCMKHPGRFHLFGCNWLRAINQLKDLLFSGDTSKFLDGGRYGHLVYQERGSKSTYLNQAPARLLDKGHLNRAQRCIESARAMNEFCNGWPGWGGEPGGAVVQHRQRKDLR